MNPREILVAIAKEEMSVRETSFNRGAGIEKYWADTWLPNGYQDREPYCAAGLCYTIAEAIRRGFELGLTKTTRPQMPAVRDWIPWANKPGTGALVFLPTSAKYKPQAGDIVVFTWSHIGLVEAGSSDAKIRTLEFNTDAAGSREGNGNFAKARTLSQVGSFIRLAWKAQSV